MPASAAEFVAKAAHFLAELNAVQAFREGNGRAQLSFFALLADQAGQPLDLENLDPDAMLNAMIASFDGDQTELVQVISGLKSAEPALYAIEYKQGHDGRASIGCRQPQI